MKFCAKARNIQVSPYKLRPFADVIRGKNIPLVLNWLSLQKLKKALPLKKLVESAVANAQYTKEVAANDLRINEIKIDQGKTFKYFKPGAMGRGNVYKRRFCHISIVLETKEKEV